MVKRFTLVVIILTLSLGLLSGDLVRAQVQISNFHLSNVPDGPEFDNFASNTSVVYVIFDYIDADNTELTVEIKDCCGNTIFEKRDTYNGSGTRSLAVRGADVFDEYERLAQTYGTSMEGYVDQAVAESTPTMARRLVEFALDSGTQLDRVLQTLGRYDLPPAAADHLEQARSYLDQALNEGQEIVNVTITPDDQVHSRAEHMQSMAQQALDEMEEALLLSEGEGKPFLDGPYTAIIKGEYGLIESIEWEVSPHGVEAPTPSPTATIATATRTPTPTVTPTPQRSPTPTRTQIPPTATRTPRPATPTRTPRAPTDTPTTTTYPGAEATATPELPATATGIAPPQTVTVIISTPESPTAPTELAPPATAPVGPTPSGPEVTQTPAAVTVPPTVEVTGTVLPPLGTEIPPLVTTPAPSPGPPGSSLNTFGLLGGAVALGLLALWIRKKFGL